MNKNTKRMFQIVILNSFITVILFSGCGFGKINTIECAPEVNIEPLENTIEYADYEVIERVETVEEEELTKALVADPSMDIENKFFDWAVAHSKALVNMQISFFRPDFYGFRSGNVSNLPATPESNNDGRLPRIPDFDPNIATKYVTASGNTYYIIGLNLYDSSGNWRSSITEDYGMDMFSYAEREDTLDWSSDVGKDYYEEIDGIMHHFYWTEDEGLLNKWTDENGITHIQGFH